MKQLSGFLALSFLFFACNNSSSNSSSAVDSSHAMMRASSADSMPPMVEISEGTMSMQNGKMNIMKSGKWELMSEPSTCTNDCQVLTNGKVIMKNGKQIKMKEGEMIDREGHLIGPDGKVLTDQMQMIDTTE